MARSSIGSLVVVALLLALVAPAGAVAPAGWSATTVLPPAPIPGANGLGFDADGQLYVGSAGVGIFKVDKETGAIGGFWGPGGEWGADDLVVGPDGAIYHTAIMNGTVGRLAPDGTHTILNKTPIPGVNPITFSDDGRLFVGTAFFGDALYEFDPTGVTEPRLIVEGLGLNGFDWYDGKLWAPRMTTGELVTVDTETGETATVTDGFTYPASADVRADGMVVVVDAGANQVVLVDPGTGDQSLLAPNGFTDGLDNAAFDPDGRLFVTYNDSGRIVELMDQGVLREVSPGGVMVGPAGLTCIMQDGDEFVVAADLFDLHIVFPDGAAEPMVVPGGFVKGHLGMPITAGNLSGRVVTTSWFDSQVGVFDPLFLDTIKSFPYDPAAGIVPINAIGYGPTIVVAELSEKGSYLVWLSPVDGSRWPFAKMTVPTGLATDGSDLWAADWGTGQVVQVVDDGQVIRPRVLAEGLAQPEGLALLPDGRLVVAETAAGRLTLIDPATATTSVIAEGLQMSPNGTPGEPPTGFFTGVTTSADGSVWVSANGLQRFTPQT
jgi:sugar lactone lactonase YvrE